MSAQRRRRSTAPLKILSGLAALGAPARAQDTGLDRWSVIRVEEPDAAGALTSSAYGAVLEAPPEDGTPWRIEPTPHLDSYEAWEAAEALDVGPWHEAGWRGQGVKIAVFDSSWGGAEQRPDELAGAESHDCYVHPGCGAEIDSLYPRFGFEMGVHGVACAEVIRDLAPEAELHLVRVNGLTTLESAADWAIRNEIDVVSMSMSFFADSFYDGSGPVGAVAERLSDAGVLFVVSSGNYARGHWWQDFTDGDGDGRHEFPWGSEYLPIYLSEGTSRIYLSWDNFQSCGATDLDAWLFDADGRVMDRAEGVQEPGGEGCEPVERIRADAPASDWYYMRVFRRAGIEATRFDVLSTSGSVYQSIAERSMADPASHPRAFTVGAVRGVGYLENDAESFSSWGPNHDGEPKPDVAAPDGLTTSSYGPTGFYGTSAATPAAAAAIALILSRYPELTPAEAASQLEAWAYAAPHPVWGAYDYELGAGKARLPSPDAPGPGGCRERAGAWLMAALLPLGWRRRRWGERRTTEHAAAKAE